MRLIRYALWGLAALCFIIIGFANRNEVTLTLLPDELVPFVDVNWAVTLPLYVVVFGGVAIGLLIGYFLEWVRESRMRSAAQADRREKAVLEAEVNKLKKDRNEGKDDVLALLEDGAPAR